MKNIRRAVFRKANWRKYRQLTQLVAVLSGMLIIAVLIARLPLRWPGQTPGAGTPSTTTVVDGPAATVTPVRTPTPPPTAKGKAAIEEGRLVWWHSLDEATGRAVLTTFKQRYPQILVDESQSMPLAQLYPRLMADIKAGGSSVDVVTVTDLELVWDMQQRGLLAEYVSPGAGVVPAIYRSQPPVFWTATDCDPIGVVYNPRLITATTAITSYAQFGQPQWKGLLALDESPGETQLAWGFGMESVAGWDFLAQIAKNRPLIYASPASMLTQVAAGKAPVALNAPWSVARRYLGGSADLRLFQPPEGVPARCGAVALMAQAPRPNAGQVFIDFILSPEGQNLLGPNRRGTYPSRKDGNGPAGLPAPGSFTIIQPNSWDDYGRAGRELPVRWEKAFGPLR
jgi:iron(III) transport system substrate-binding protein